MKQYSERRDPLISQKENGLKNKIVIENQYSKYYASPKIMLKSNRATHIKYENVIGIKKNKNSQYISTFNKEAEKKDDGSEAYQYQNHRYRNIKDENKDEGNKIVKIFQRRIVDVKYLNKSERNFNFFQDINNQHYKPNIELSKNYSEKEILEKNNVDCLIVKKKPFYKYASDDSDKNSDNEKKNKKKKNNRAISNPEGLNSEKLYHGNAYFRRIKFWESKSTSKDRESSKESNESKNKYSNDNNRINNLRENLKSTINDTKNVIQKLPLSFISKKIIIYKTLPINNVFFCSKKIRKIKILPIVNLFFMSKKIINIKKVVVNNISFISKTQKKAKFMPRLNISFISKIKKNIKQLPQVELFFMTKKIRKFQKNIECTLNKFYSKKQFEKIYFSKHIDKIKNNQKLSYSGNKCNSLNNIVNGHILTKIEKANSFLLEKEIKKKPIIPLLYITKNIKDKNEINSNIFQKNKNKLCYITKIYIKNDNSINEKILKKQLLNNNKIIRLFISPIKKPINNKCNIIKYYYKQPINIPKKDKCYISKLYFIKAFKRPLSLNCYITKIKNNQICSIKHPKSLECYITKNIIKQNQNETPKKILKQSSNDILNSEPIKLVKKAIIKDNLVETLMSNSNPNSNLKIKPKKRTRRGGKAAKRRHSNHSKGSSDFSQNNSNISKNSFKSEISIESNHIFFIKPRIESYSGNKSPINGIDKKYKIPIPPKKEKNLNEYTLQIEREVEFQIDDNKSTKNFLSQSNNFNLNDNEQSLKYWFKNNFSERDNKDDINLFIKNPNNNNKKTIIKKNFRSSSSIIDNYSFQTPTKDDKLKNNFDDIIIGRKLFDQEMLIDSQKEIQRRKQEIIPINDYHQLGNLIFKIKDFPQKKKNYCNINSDKIIIPNNNFDVIINEKYKLKKSNSMNDIRYNQNQLIKNFDYVKKDDCLNKSVENKHEENEENNTTLTDSHGIKLSPIRDDDDKKINYTTGKKYFKKIFFQNIPKPNSMSLQFILSVKNNLNSFETYSLTKEVIDHCNALKNPVYNEIFDKSNSEKKNILHSRNKSSNYNCSLYKNINVNLNLNHSFNKEDSMSKWAKKDFTKENEKAEQYIKDLDNKLSENLIKHDITSILNIVTVDNFDIISNKLLKLLNNSEEKQFKFIEVIIEKAFVENSYVVLYAQLCRVLCEIIGGKRQDECYLRRKLFEEVKNAFDKLEDNKNDKELIIDEYYSNKKKLLGLINLIVELIEVKILSQKMGFYCLNSLYNKYIESNNKSEYSFKYINLETIIFFLSKFGKIIFNRNKNDNKNKLKNFMNKKLFNIKDEESIPGHLKYRIINLFEKQKNNWKDSLYEKSFIPKGKGLNNEETKAVLSEFDREDIVKNDLKKWFNYLNKNNILSPEKIKMKTFNNYNWKSIDKLIVEDKVELIEIIRCFIEVSIDLINKKDDIFKANQYIYSIVDYYSQFLNDNEINLFNNKINSLFLEVNNLIIDNKLIFEILGFLMYILINLKLFYIKDLAKFIDKDKESIINISIVVKFAIEFSGKDKKKYLNDFRQNKLYSTYKELFNEIIAEKII